MEAEVSDIPNLGAVSQDLSLPRPERGLGDAGLSESTAAFESLAQESGKTSRRRPVFQERYQPPYRLAVRQRKASQTSCRSADAQEQIRARRKARKRLVRAREPALRRIVVAIY